MINELECFKLFADCIPTRGYKRGVIYDLNRKAYDFIPNSLIDFVQEADGKTKVEIEQLFGEEDKAVVSEYLKFLENKEYSYWVPKTVDDNFLKLNLDWDYPAQISNAIIEIDHRNNYNVAAILKQLDDLGCKHIQICAYDIIEMDYYTNLLNEIIYSQYLSIEIITKFDSNIKLNSISEFVTKHKRLKSIVFHSADKNQIINEIKLSTMGNIAYTKQKIASFSQHNSIEYFSVSVDFFTESQNNHIYFNRKVSIDVEGNIKNCPTDKTIYGNVNKDKITDVISLSSFQKLWNVKKDETKVCKDCEFRYMCTDGRIPKQSEDGTWYHETACNYNPYMAKWKGEIGYKNSSQKT